MQNARCCGAAHGGCKRGCTIFWREAWLRLCAPDATVSCEPSACKTENVDQLAQQLRTKAGDHSERFYCQSSELLRATRPLTAVERLGRCVRNVTTGNYGFGEMVRNICVWIGVRGREKLLGPFPRGELKKTPAESLNLQVGELVEVKPLSEIKLTLDQRGLNRGLHFAPEMIPYCGKRLRVVALADRMIMEGTGQMRTMKNTVLLEDSICDSATWAFGACPREDLIYWREIWLKRVDSTTSSVESGVESHA